MILFPDDSVMLKDEEHVDESGRLGRYSPAVAADIYEIGRRLGTDLSNGDRWWDDQWTEWVPTSRFLVPPRLPADWSAEPVSLITDLGR